LDLSIDAHLFLKQLEKSLAFHPFFTRYLPEWSVEQHASWKEIVAGCPPLEPYLTPIAVPAKPKPKVTKPKPKPEQQPRRVANRSEAKEHKEDKEKTYKHRPETRQRLNPETKQEQKREMLVTTWAKEFGAVALRRMGGARGGPTHRARVADTGRATMKGGSNQIQPDNARRKERKSNAHKKEYSRSSESYSSSLHSPRSRPRYRSRSRSRPKEHREHRETTTTTTTTAQRSSTTHRPPQETKEEPKTEALSINRRQWLADLGVE
jgi:hypothetical protein